MAKLDTELKWVDKAESWVIFAATAISILSMVFLVYAVVSLI